MAPGHPNLDGTLCGISHGGAAGPRFLTEQSQNRVVCHPSMVVAAAVFPSYRLHNNLYYRIGSGCILNMILFETLNPPNL